jgi:hypothetical protein
MSEVLHTLPFGLGAPAAVLVGTGDLTRHPRRGAKCGRVPRLGLMLRRRELRVGVCRSGATRTSLIARTNAGHYRMRDQISKDCTDARRQD